MDYSLEKFNFNSELLQKILQSNILLYFVVLLLVLKISTTLISINIPHNMFFADITKSALENFANQTRQSAGLKPLTENAKLNQAAELKAENMVRNQYFAHTSPTGISPWFWFSKAGYNYKYAGENLAIGFFESEEVFNAWLNSPSHRANIISPNYTEVGTAVLKGFGQENAIVVVQEFGSRIPVKPVAVKNDTQKPIVVKPQVQQPAPKPAEPATVIDNNEQVLSQTIELPNVMKPSKGNLINNLPLRILNSVVYNYDNLLQNITYGVSMVVIGILLAIIFFNFKVNFKKELVFRAALIVLLLSTSTLVNKELIISIIPHQIII